MQTVAVQTTRKLSSSEVRILSLASIGGALEFYDFIIFVFFANVIGKLFFAATEHDWVRQTLTFGVFATGYVARPFGGIVMAHFGDTRGRRRMFSLSVMLMAFPTLAIGLLPTYQSIGATAPLLLVLMRIMQGAAIGGEVPGAWVFVAEHARPQKVGFAVGLLTSGLVFGIFLGSLMATCLDRSFSQAEITASAWRIPFLFGGIFGFVAMWLRGWLKETPVFEEMRDRAALSGELPLRAVLKTHGRAIMSSIVCSWMLTGAIVVLILMTPSTMPQSFGLAPSQVQLANLAATAALWISTILIGAATDRFGIRRLAIPTPLLLIASTYGLYYGAAIMPSALLPLYALAGFGAGATVLMPIIMIHAFPAPIRFSGVSFSHNLTYAMFGGLTPLLIPWLVHLNRFGPAHYIAFVAVAGFGAILIAPNHRLSI